MKYIRKFIDKENYYTVGIDEETNDYLMEVVVTGIAWYSRFFKLKPNEIERFLEDENSLLNLSKKLTKPSSKELEERLVHSDKADES